MFVKSWVGVCPFFVAARLADAGLKIPPNPFPPSSNKDVMPKQYTVHKVGTTEAGELSWCGLWICQGSFDDKASIDWTRINCHWCHAVRLGDRRRSRFERPITVLKQWASRREAGLTTPQASRRTPRGLALVGGTTSLGVFP